MNNNIQKRRHHEHYWRWYQNSFFL